MAEGSEEQNKSEEATPFKLDRARRKGMVARGTDLGFLSTLVGLVIVAQLLGEGLVAKLVLAVKRSFLAAAPMATGIDGVSGMLAREAAGVARALILPSLIIAMIVIVAEIVQIRGVVFSAQPLKPDFSRLNPAKGLKRLLSARMFKELLKSIFKFAVYATAAFLFIRHLAADLALRASDGRQLPDVLVEAAGKLLLLFVILAALMALVDQLLARREFAKQMRMSRREVTREVREREGEPRQKKKRKQILDEILRQAGAASDVKGADILIVNPTHYAVALRYRPEETDAPVVRGKGRNAWARRMRETAQHEGITIVRNPRLARALYHESRIGQPIGSLHFVAVADIYIMLRRSLQERDGAV